MSLVWAGTTPMQAIHRYLLTPATLYAETSHKVGVKFFRSGFGPKDPVPDDEKLNSEVREVNIWR